MSPVSPFHAVEQVLDQFQDRFFHEVDTASIILDLVHWSIIDGGDVEAIMREDDQNLKNEILYHSLKNMLKRGRCRGGYICWSNTVGSYHPVCVCVCVCVRVCANT